MAKTKYLTGECQHCAGSLEFPAENIGFTATCPHCGKETELQLATPVIQPAVPRRILVWTLLAVALLVGGLIVSIAGLNHYQKQLAERRKSAIARTNAPAPAPEDPFAAQGFKTSGVQLEKANGSSLVYAIGTVANQADHQRFGVRVELDVLDGAGRRVGSAKDYQAVLEPRTEWRFKALVISSNAISAKISAITEDKGH